MCVIEERNEVRTTMLSRTPGNDLSGSLEGAGGIGGLLARSQHSTTPTLHSFYHADGNGNITCLIATNQSVVASYRYDPFGNITAQSGTLADANTYRFSSKELHVQSGLYYYGYRFYDPSLQRWMNRDPIEELGGINLYAFVGNSPVSKFDKNGHVAWVPICCLTCTGLGIWDVIEVVQDETCAYGSASERAVCLLNKLVGNDLGACVLEALGGVINGGSLDEAKDKIADCFKCDGWKAARDVAKAISCTCCMGGLASKIRVPAPRLPPSPAPAAL